MWSLQLTSWSQSCLILIQNGEVKLVLWRHWNAPEQHASSDVREPISVHEAVQDTISGFLFPAGQQDRSSPLVKRMLSPQQARPAPRATMSGTFFFYCDTHTHTHTRTHTHTSVVLAATYHTGLKYRRCRLSCLPFVWHFFSLWHTRTHTHAHTHTHTHTHTLPLSLYLFLSLSLSSSLSLPLSLSLSHSLSLFSLSLSLSLSSPSLTRG